MKLVLITCINPDSTSSNEWSDWQKADLSLKGSNCLVGSIEGNELYVINGQEKFDYWQVKNNINDFLTKLKDIIEIINISSHDDILAIHYGGGDIDHEKLQEFFDKKKKELPDDLKRFFEDPINHSGNTFIITYYSIGGSDKFKSCFDSYTNDPNPENLNKIFAFFLSKRKKELNQKAEQKVLEIVEAIQRKLIPVKFYLKAFYEKKNGSKEKVEEAANESVFDNLIEICRKLKDEDINNSIRNVEDFFKNPTGEFKLMDSQGQEITSFEDWFQKLSEKLNKIIEKHLADENKSRI